MAWNATNPAGLIAEHLKSPDDLAKITALRRKLTREHATLSAKLKVGAQDDLRFMISGGDGVGRYIGLNFSNDAVLDASGELDAIGVIAGFAAYRHIWTPGWRSNLIWSVQEVEDRKSVV